MTRLSADDTARRTQLPDYHLMQKTLGLINESISLSDEIESLQTESEIESNSA